MLKASYHSRIGGVFLSYSGSNPLQLVDNEQFVRIIEVFTRATDVTIDINDARGYPLVEHDFFYGFCRNIRLNPEGLKRCIKSNAEVGYRASVTGQSSICKCHAGLTLVAVPILIDGEFSGTVTAGQMHLEQPGEAALRQMLEATRDLNFDSGELTRAFLQVQVISLEKCRATAELIQYVVNSIAELIYFHNLHESRTREKLILMREAMNRAEMENALRMAELKNLQAQIKPHFLFNTLNTIRGLIILEENEKALATLYSLSGLLRNSFSSREDLVTLGEEIDYVNNYLSIQKARFGEKIRVDLDIDRKLLNSPLPCLTLQPLVENACNHGLEFCEEGGLVSITARAKGTDMEISVTDNGPGFPEKVLHQLNSYFTGAAEEKHPQTPQGAGGGIGLRNVHRRLQLFFGKNYGLGIESRPGYSRVTMTLPAVDLHLREGGPVK